MKRGGTWIVLGFFAIAAALLAWMLRRDVTLDGPSSEPAAMQLESNETPVLYPAPTTELHSTNRTAVSPLVGRRTVAPPVQTTAPVSNRTSAALSTAPDEKQESVSPSRDTRVLSPRSLEGGSVNPFDGTPEREIIGIGAVLMRRDGALQIRDVLPGSPAALANLSGCKIQSVDGINVADLSMEECVRLIRGVAGSSVKLDVIDPAQQRLTVEVVRNKVQL